LAFQHIRFAPIAVACGSAGFLAPAFHPYQALLFGGYFLWHYAVPAAFIPQDLPVRKYVTLRCPDFPPFAA